jgi:hypothetical protein
MPAQSSCLLFRFWLVILQYHLIRKASCVPASARMLYVWHATGSKQRLHIIIDADISKTSIYADISKTSLLLRHLLQHRAEKSWHDLTSYKQFPCGSRAFDPCCDIRRSGILQRRKFCNSRRGIIRCCNAWFGTYCRQYVICYIVCS